MPWRKQGAQATAIQVEQRRLITQTAPRDQQPWKKQQSNTTPPPYRTCSGMYTKRRLRHTRAHKGDVVDNTFTEPWGEDLFALLNFCKLIMMLEAGSGGFWICIVVLDGSLGSQGSYSPNMSRHMFICSSSVRIHLATISLNFKHSRPLTCQELPSSCWDPPSSDDSLCALHEKRAALQKQWRSSVQCGMTLGVSYQGNQETLL